jgi:tetratricopeptide (TPR) repeat protein
MDATESPGETMNREEILASAQRSQVLFAETLSRGALPVDKEIEMRTHLAEFFIQIGTLFSEHKVINDAIQHLDTVLCRVSEDSPNRPKILNEISSAQFQLYHLTGSQHSLDIALLYGRQAKDLASALHLHEYNLEMYLEILKNLGYFLSHRFQFGSIPKDIDESIACKREVIEKTAKGSESYHLALNNLASSLHTRYISRNSREDEEEARELLEELLSSTEPGSKLHNIAVGQLGVLAVAKFHETSSMEDLDEALVYCKTGFDSCPTKDDARAEMLRQILVLYKTRYKYTQSLEYINSVVQYSFLLSESIPPTHSSRGENLLQRLQNIEQRAFAEQSSEAFEDAIDLCQAAFATMPDVFQDKERSQIILSQLMSQRYVLSNELEDLISLTEYSASVLAGYNAGIKSGYAKQDVNEDWIWRFLGVLRQLSSVPLENHIPQLAEEELLGAFLSCYDPESGQYGISALEEVCRQNGERLHVLAAAAIADTTLCEEDVEIEIWKLGAKQSISHEDFLETHFGCASELETEFGLRKLAIDPETNHITFDFTNLVRDVLGYEEGGVTPNEFVDREERMEGQSLEKGRLDGTHPNPRLCRWCRQLTKPLQPSSEGFRFTADRCVVPNLGDWRMILYCRGECAICSLVAAIITTDKGELHADFEKVDQEARSISMSCGMLSTGESVLSIKFGVSHAGELRMLTKDNYRQALRQGWEANKSVAFRRLLDDRDGPIYDTGGQQVNFDLINAWLNDCDHNHGTICNQPRPAQRIKAKIPLTFIDVGQQCLVSGTSNDKYFALSYTWGQVDMCVTLKDNFEERRQPQGLSKVMFPKTIKDAIRLAFLLGVRLLWIDAVCIVQDDPDHKARDIPNMDIIYGRAFATIVALSGDNADAGLPGVNPGSRSVQRIETLPITRGSSDLDYDPQRKDNEIVRLVRAPQPFYLALRMSNWNTRG